jgi:hypothetical protein
MDNSEAMLDEMMAEAPGPLNFTMFLTLFAEKLNGMFGTQVARYYFLPCDRLQIKMFYEPLHSAGLSARVHSPVFMPILELPSILLSFFSPPFFFHTATGTDPEDNIKNAFGCFDPEATGLIDEDKFVELSSTLFKPRAFTNYSFFRYSSFQA